MYQTLIGLDMDLKLHQKNHQLTSKIFVGWYGLFLHSEVQMGVVNIGAKDFSCTQ